MKRTVSLALVIALLIAGASVMKPMKAKAVIDFSEYVPRKGEELLQDGILYMVYDDYAEVISYLGTDGNMDIKPYVQGKPVTALANWCDMWNDDDWFDINEHSIDSKHKVKRLVIPHTVKELKVGNFTNGAQNSLFEYSNTLEELIIEDGAEISIFSENEERDARILNLINANSNRLLDNLKYVYIGSAVKEVSPALFCGNSMERIEVSKENPYYYSEENILFNRDKTELIISGTANQLTEYVVPKTVEKIGLGFQLCHCLSKITLNENVKTIAEKALYTESESLEIVVPYGSYAETYAKGLKADYIKCTVLGAPEQSEILPTAEPTVQPTKVPVTEPTVTPTKTPTAKPTVQPATSSPAPTTSASPRPTAYPNQVPSGSPTVEPTNKPATKYTAVSPTPSVKDKKIKKGSKVIDKKTKAVYKITETGKNRTVEYVKSTGKNPVSISVPASVKLKGKTYKVTAVGKAAFKNSKKLKMVTLGKNVKKIGKQAFYHCKNLRYILVKTKKLSAKSVGSNAFGKGAANPRVKTDKCKWRRYSRIFLSKGMSKKAVFVIDPVKLVI